jgi:hypothetical protein
VVSGCDDCLLRGPEYVADYLDGGADARWSVVWCAMLLRAPNLAADLLQWGQTQEARCLPRSSKHNVTNMHDIAKGTVENEWQVQVTAPHARVPMIHACPLPMQTKPQPKLASDTSPPSDAVKAIGV